MQMTQLVERSVLTPTGDRAPISEEVKRREEGRRREERGRKEEKQKPTECRHLLGRCYDVSWFSPLMVFVVRSERDLGI